MSDQPYEPDTTAALEILAESPLFSRLDRAARAEIGDDLEMVSLAAGQPLFLQGDPGDSMYIVESGLLEARMRDAAGVTRVVDRLDASAGVGEMALLTGRPRTADIVAVVDSRLLRVPKIAFDRLTKRHPAIASGFALAVTPRLHRLKLAGILGRLFGDMDPSALHAIQEQLLWKRLADGEALFHQGDFGTSMFIVVNGRLQMVLVDGGDERVLGEIRAGETVGEFALLTDDIRSATVVATRDTDVVEITRPVFESLTRQHPQVMAEIARMIALRQKRSLRAMPDDLPGALTIAVVPAGAEGAPIREFAAHLYESLTELGSTALFTSERFDAEYGKPGAAQIELDDALSIVVNSWIAEQEERYAHILFVADPEWTNWTQRCLNQSDRIIMFGAAESNPGLGTLEQFCSPRARKELVLVYRDETEEIGTHSWLLHRDVAAVHHARLDDVEDWQRLARRVAG